MASQRQNGYQESGAGIELQDDEGLVDRKTKEHILDLRKQIDNDERELFVAKATDPNINLSRQKAVQHWAISVKQYLRSIKRLWHTEGKSDVKNVAYYWQEKNITEYTLVPPDKDGYQFSLIAREDVTEDQLRMMLNLPRGADPPKPEVVTFDGLESVLNRDTVEHTWFVWTEKTGARRNWDQLTIQHRTPLPKDLLEDAVEVADDFLQQAGLGFDITAQPYEADGEPGV
jgi:hypothetical protein